MAELPEKNGFVPDEDLDLQEGAAFDASLDDDDDEDESEFHFPVEAWEGNPSEDWVRGVTAMQEGRLEEAIAAGHEAVDAWDDYFDAWLLLAGAHMDRGDAPEALEAASNALEIAQRQRLEALDVYAFTLMNNDRFDEAAAIYTTLLDEGAARPLCYWYRALCRVMQREYAAAREDLVKAVELRPEFAEDIEGEPVLSAVYAGRTPEV